MSDENHSGIDKSRCRPGLLRGADPVKREDVPDDDDVSQQPRSQWDINRPFSFDPIFVRPEKSEKELLSAADAVLEEQLKLIETFSQIPEEENAEELRS
jgi:hypothetical protein